MEKQTKQSVVKVSAGQFLVGEIPFLFEQQVGSNLSLEGEFGLTISEIDYNGWARSVHTSEFNYIDFEHKTTATLTDGEFGFTGSFGLRYYALGNKRPLAGLYVGPHFKFKRYRYTMTGVDANDVAVNAPLTVNDDRMTFSFRVGYQFWINKLSIDLFGGVGLTQRVNNQPRSYQHWYDGQWNYYWEERALKSTYARGILGINIGLGMK